MLSWHVVPPEAIYTELSTGPDGLDGLTAARRLAEHGPNRLAATRPISAVRVLLDQLKSVVVLLLIAAAGVTFALGEHVETAAIAAVLAINTLIGFVTELRARRAMEALLQFDVSKATVVRGGQLTTIDAAELVPGDIIQLDVGRRVPADARLLATSDLRTDEAALTGESLPVSKDTAARLDAETPLADRVNMVYKGTTAVAGTGRAVIIATGQATEIGRIGTLAAEVEERQTPLERRLDQLGHRLVWLALGVAAAVAALGFWQGAPLGQVIEMGIALAVAAVPEALPAVATIALAVGVHRMARRHALVRRLPAVEALGSATIVCTDKTRTLTSGRMTLVRVWANGRDYVTGAAGAEADAALSDALEVAVLASRPQPDAIDGQPGHGDPVDLALMAAGRTAGIDRQRLAASRPEIGLVPFSSDRKYMVSFHDVDGSATAFAKGAPRQIVSMSDLDASARQRVLETNDRMAREGLRVLALASGPVSAARADAVSGLRFVALVGFADPPAEGVEEAIDRLRGAGLRTVMLTGDQRATAEAVGRQLHLFEQGGAIVDGRELDAMSAEELAGKLGNVAAFSRITPEHKLKIVEGLQAQGGIVAMLGDGVNDAPALRRADIGVAMGIRGTDVAKEAAAIVLQDDRFETIAAAVEEGRVIFDNIRKFVFYLFSCNVAEVLVLLCAGVAGLPPPLLPLQVLWLNMVTDTFPALALALEPADHDVMKRGPRDPAEALLSRAFLIRVLSYGGLITASSLAAFLLYRGEPLARAQTMTFMTLAFAQLLHLGNARSDAPLITARGAVSNPFALAAVGLSVGAQVAAAHIEPLARVLRIAPLSAQDWVIVVGLGAVPAVVGQIIKLRAVSRAAAPTAGR